MCREKGLPVLNTSQSMPHHPKQDYTRRLKLVTGVDISTRPVRRSGREGNAKNRSSLRAVAEPKRSAFRRSMTIMRQLSPQQLPTKEMQLLKAPIVQLKLRCVQNGELEVPPQAGKVLPSWSRVKFHYHSELQKSLD